MKKQWVVIGQTDGYHASKYAHKTGGREMWVETREYCTEEEMSKKMLQWLEQEGGDNYSHWTNKQVEEIAKEGEDVSWFEGEGVYREGSLVAEVGSLAYSEDVWMYSAITEEEFISDERYKELQ